MSEQQEPVKKVVHRIEPKQQPIVLSKNPGAQKHEKLSNLPKTVNAQYFREQLYYEEVLEAEWGQEVTQRQVWRRSLVTGLLVFSVFFLGCAIWAIVLISGTREEVKAEPATAASTELSFEKKSELRNAAVAAYLRAGTLQEKALYVRDPQRVMPLMVEYYKKFPIEPEMVRSPIEEAPVMGKDGLLWRVNAREKNSSVSPYLLVETQDDGTSLVDWETDVVYQSSDWSAFKASKSTEVHAFRAKLQIAQSGGFYGFEFSNYNRFRCFKVTLPSSDDYLWAYTEIGSEEDAKMVRLITAGGRKNINTKRYFPVILELRYPENAQSSRCVHLSRLIQDGWLD